MSGESASVIRLGALALAACLAAACVREARPEPLPRGENGPLCAELEADRLTERPASAGSVFSARPPLRVHYCHPRLEPLASRVLRTAIHSHEEQVERLGFAPPLSDGERGGGPELDIYLVNLGRAGRSQANEEPPTPGAPTYPGYVVLDYRTPEPHEFLASYITHELNHVMQYAVGAKVAAPFLEAVSAYVDDQLHPRADVLPALVADFQRAPFRPLSFHDEDTSYDYGAALFIDFLVKRHGLPLVHSVLTANEANYLQPLERQLSERGSSLERELREFARCRVRTARYAAARCFSDARRFPEVSVDQFVSPFMFIGEPFTVRPLQPPQELGTTYLAVDLTTPLEGGLAIELTADTGPGALAVELLGSDSLEPLDSALLSAGERRTLTGHKLRPGMRLWLAVTHLGQRPVHLEPGAAGTAHGFTATFRRLPEPE